MLLNFLLIQITVIYCKRQRLKHVVIMYMQDVTLRIII